LTTFGKIKLENIKKHLKTQSIELNKMHQPKNEETSKHKNRDYESPPKSLTKQKNKLNDSPKK
jgi:hypothetical protein